MWTTVCIRVYINYTLKSISLAILIDIWTYGFRLTTLNKKVSIAILLHMFILTIIKLDLDHCQQKGFPKGFKGERILLKWKQSQET